MQLRVQRRSPPRRVGGPEQQHGGRADRGGHVRHPGVAAQQQPAPTPRARPGRAGPAVRTSPPRRGVAPATRAHRSRSAGTPVTTTRWPRRRARGRRPATARPASGVSPTPHRDARPPRARPAPGAGGARPPAGPAAGPRAHRPRRRRSPAGTTGRPRARRSSQAGPSLNPASGTGERRPAGGVRAPQAARWLCGPRPCRLTATSGAGRPPAGTGSSSPDTGSTVSTTPSSCRNRPAGSGAASASSAPGHARRTPRSAGTPVSRSPSPSARSATTYDAGLTARTAPSTR